MGQRQSEFRTIRAHTLCGGENVIADAGLLEGARVGYKQSSVEVESTGQVGNGVVETAGLASTVDWRFRRQKPRLYANRPGAVFSQTIQAEKNSAICAGLCERIGIL